MWLEFLRKRKKLHLFCRILHNSRRNPQAPLLSTFCGKKSAYFPHHTTTKTRKPCICNGLRVLYFSHCGNFRGTPFAFFRNSKKIPMFMGIAAEVMHISTRQPLYSLFGRCFSAPEIHYIQEQNRHIENCDYHKRHHFHGQIFRKDSKWILYDK